MTDKIQNYINIIKSDFPLIHSKLDPEKLLTDSQLWHQIDSIIKESQAHHNRLDVSGLRSILSIIKHNQYTKEWALTNDGYVDYYNIHQRAYQFYLNKIKKNKKEIAKLNK